MRKSLRKRSRGVTGSHPLFGSRSISSGRFRSLAALLVGLAMAGCQASDGDNGPPGPAGPPGPGTTTLADGLEMKITSVDIPTTLHPVVEFTLEDGDGNPVDLGDLDASPRFGIAWIETGLSGGLSRYKSYVVNSRSGADYVHPVTGATTPPAMAAAEQAGTDSGGLLETIAPGSHRYTFNVTLPAGYRQDATHTVAGYAYREGRAFVSNDVYHFVPSGAPVTETREVVDTASCNQCHNPLALHGGTRREIGLCTVCHTDQSTDPETGETVDMTVMIHKIHRGADLASLPYFIVGYKQGVHDYSEVQLPMDIRNCTKCHSGVADADHWKTRPSRAACGSCHDDIDWVTGANHFGGPQNDDGMCSSCHADTMTTEFDQSVPGAHVVPYDSSSNPNLTLTITDVQGMTPGNTPDVRFTINDDAGPVEIATLDRVAIVFAGPTGDYTQLISLDHRLTIHGFGSRGLLTPNGPGDYTFTASGYQIPVGAYGTWSVGMEARTASIAVNDETIRFGANNPVVDIDLAVGTLGDGSPVTRRHIVDEALCSSCHGDLVFHGNLRTDLDYCAMCHNAWATDEGRRPGVDASGNPPEFIDFRHMVHRIHTGEDQANPYLVWGYGPTLHDFSHVVYPGDLKDCEKCHVNGSYELPVASTAQAMVQNIAGVRTGRLFDIQTPTTAACTGCHDSDASKTHAQLQSIIVDEWTWGESCDLCHGEGKEYAVSEVHSR